MHPQARTWSTNLHELGGSHGCHHCRRRARRRCPPRRPSPPANAARRRQHTPPAATVPIAIDEEEDDAIVVLIDTHHRRASRRAIRAIQHEEDDEHILDPSRPQADVDHRGHTRQIFLARRPPRCPRPHDPPAPPAPPLPPPELPPATASSILRCSPTNATPTICLACVVRPTMREPRSSNPGRPSEAPAAALPEVAHCHRRTTATAPPSSAHHACMWLPRRRTPSRTLPVPAAFAEAAHVNAPCSCRLQHVVNIGSAVDDRRFASNAAAKATVLAATMPIRIFYKYM
ncbi:hypothetical protein ACLOJK_003972 [Asimina triloba]